MDYRRWFHIIHGIILWESLLNLNGQGGGGYLFDMGVSIVCTSSEKQTCLYFSSFAVVVCSFNSSSDVVFCF